ncbi:hypothetical protein BDV93DRAFT_546293 [Ceratobasidium sp. AG-I]|nr:hypothetical protein BDV93DRAFT_546293 [Ceratobasidium sp. AG-I]
MRDETRGGLRVVVENRPTCGRRGAGGMGYTVEPKSKLARAREMKAWPWGGKRGDGGSKGRVALAQDKPWRVVDREQDTSRLWVEDFEFGGATIPQDWMTNARKKFSKTIRIKADTMKPSVSPANVWIHAQTTRGTKRGRRGLALADAGRASGRLLNYRTSGLPSCAWSDTRKLEREVGQAEVDAVELVDQARRTGEMNIAVETQLGNTRSYALCRRYGDEMETAGTEMRGFRDI